MMQLNEAFYLPLGDGAYASTPSTSGPWDERLQHGGPPEALLARELRRAAAAHGDTPFALGRITFEILGPIPVADVTVTAEVTRPGRRVQQLEGTLSAGGRPVLTARAWQVTPAASEDVTDDHVAPALPDAETPLAPPWDRSGYLRALEWRWTRGDYNEAGPGSAWARSRIPLVAGEPLDGLSRLLLVADSANGVSGTLPLDGWYFIPPETTIHLLREPEGEWISLEARTTIAGGGAGLAQSVLSDARGVVGHSAQTLLIAPR